MMKQSVVASAAYVALALFGLTLVAGGAAATPVPRATLAKHPLPLRIVAFGSSSTEGIGASRPSATYPAQLQADLNMMMPKGWSVEVVNRGIGGEDADDMAKRLQDDVIARHPEVVIWQTGSNDPLRHVPLDRFERETRDGVAAMRKAGIEVILMEPQWCPRLDSVVASSGYRDTVRHIGNDMKVDVIRRSDMMHDWIRQGVLTRATMLSADGLHMTDGGYALLARSVAPEVLKVEDLVPQVRTVSDAGLAKIAPPR